MKTVAKSKKAPDKKMVKPKHIFINEHTIYVRNLSYERNILGVKTIFSKYGLVKYVKIVVDPKTLRSMGMAFVEMGDTIEAHRAILGTNNKIIDGRTIKTTNAIPMKPKPKRAPRPFSKNSNNSSNPKARRPRN